MRASVCNYCAAMSRISGSWILSGVVIVIFVAALPGAIARVIRTGDLYLFTDHFFRDILARLSGPGRLRFILQPAVAIILGTRGGIRDASAGLPPFLWGLVHASEHRRELLRSSLSATRNLLAIAILLDLVSQFLIFHEIHPAAALVVGPVLIAVPYGLSRAFSNRIWCWRNHDKPTAHAS